MTNLIRRSCQTEGTVMIRERWTFEKSILWRKSASFTAPLRISTQPSSCANKQHGEVDEIKSHHVITALCMRRRCNYIVCPSIHGAERQRSCWSHDCRTVLAGVGGAISRAIWVNRRRLLLRHEASPPDLALLTLGRFCGHTQTDGTFAAWLKPALGLQRRSGKKTNCSWPRLKPIHTSRFVPHKHKCKPWNFKEFLSALIDYLHFMKRICGICMLREFAGSEKTHVHVQSSRLPSPCVCLLIALVLALKYASIY